MEVNPSSQSSSLVNSAESLLVTLVIAVFIITFIVQAFQIPSESMEDTLLVGDYLLVDKLHYGSGELALHAIPYGPVKRGDVIVFKYPVDPRQHFVKRVIAIPGDHLRLENRRVYLNGVMVQESYAHFTSRVHEAFRDDFPQLDSPGSEVTSEWWLQMRKLVDDGQLIIPDGSYFVMGDNRDDSLDSRYWGFVPRANIVGRPLLIYWSVRSTNPEFGGTSTAGDKLFHFVYAVTHLVQITRWDRTFRLVH
jgi:signal peptidase I